MRTYLLKYMCCALLYLSGNGGSEGLHDTKVVRAAVSAAGIKFMINPLSDFVSLFLF